MTTHAVLPPVASSATIPFDLAATEGDAGWRERLVWPLPQTARRALIGSIGQSLARELMQMDEGAARDAALVACPGLLLTAATLSCVAALLEAARAGGVEITGGPPELAELAGAAAGSETFTPGAYLHPPDIRFSALRRLARTASWSTPSRFVRAIIGPDALVLSHNPLLRSYARTHGHAVWYFPADQLMGRVSAVGVDEQETLLSDLAGHLARCASGAPNLDQAATKRLQDLLYLRFNSLLAEAVPELEKARQVRLPKAIWTGALSAPKTRALALLTRQDGGEVTLFDHGGGTVTSAASLVKAVRDHSLANRVVLATPRAADAAAAEWRNLPASSQSRTQFIGGAGEPTMRCVSSLKPAQAGRPRVAYLPTPMLGFRELMVPLLPDPVALDWQLRVGKLLKSMPIQVWARPHPEGAMPGAQHPISRILPLAEGPYGQVIAGTDRFVFEYPHSTAFWEALCTDRPVILIDLGLSDLSETVRGIISRRCRLVTVRYDDRNLPLVDFDFLSEAVCGGADKADPSEIRTLLIGDEIT